MAVTLFKEKQSKKLHWQTLTANLLLRSHRNDRRDIDGANLSAAGVNSKAGRAQKLEAGLPPP